MTARQLYIEDLSDQALLDYLLDCVAGVMVMTSRDDRIFMIMCVYEYIYRKLSHPDIDSLAASVLFALHEAYTEGKITPAL